MSWTQGGPAVVKVGQTHRRLDAGEASRGGEPRVLPTGLGLAREAQLRDADARPHPTVVVARPGTSSAAAEARVQVGMGLWCVNERGEVSRRLYAMRGARWAHARDQMVTGASPATSAGGGACGWMWCGSYSVRERERRGGAGAGAHGDDDGTLGEVGDGPGPTNLTVMAGGSEVEDEPGEVVRGLLEGRGSVRWVEDGVAELVG